MTQPKTEAERIEEAAKKHSSVYQPNGEAVVEAREFDFKSGVAWRDANPLPHPDTERLNFLINERECIVNDGNGFYISGQWEPEIFDTEREAIDAAMKEEKKS